MAKTKKVGGGMTAKQVHPPAPKGTPGKRENRVGVHVPKNSPKRRYPGVSLKAAPDAVLGGNTKGMSAAKKAWTKKFGKGRKA